ncbi:hypothetical protein EJ02DRAFT_461381 [Clathrospora elynae]|uniref:Uncharacterized protein n=1 Tax=Clathrospora elynae TaxID=706981 RepID=A0A6A5T5H7_9PLEO|nr:hypothetical protein EJ02DRAFT_461381 [Clathrospora elynae]
MTGTHSGSGIGEAIRKGVGMIHGTGEAIRGNAMSAVDSASGDKASAVKNQEIANKGVDEWDHGYRGHATSAGVTPADTDASREHMNTTGSTSTNYGAHDTNIGNKLDPRYDSDMDHRGTATGSTNVGPHSTNVSNKLDPRIDSDADHRANPASKVGGESYDSWQPPHEHEHGAHPQHEHRGSIGGSSGLEAAQKLDPIFPVGADEESMKYTDHPNIHRLRGSISGASGLEAAQKLDPPEDVAARGPGYSQPEPSYQYPKLTNQSSVLDMLDPDVESAQCHVPTMQSARQYEDRYERPAQSQSEKISLDSDMEPDRQARRRTGE